MAAQDLLEGDKAKEQVRSLEEYLGNQKEIIESQDSLILNLNQKLTLESLRFQELEKQQIQNKLFQERLQGQVKAARGYAIGFGCTSAVVTTVLVLFLVGGK